MSGESTAQKFRICLTSFGTVGFDELFCGSLLVIEEKRRFNKDEYRQQLSKLSKTYTIENFEIDEQTEDSFTYRLVWVEKTGQKRSFPNSKRCTLQDGKVVRIERSAAAAAFVKSSQPKIVAMETKAAPKQELAKPESKLPHRNSIARSSKNGT